MIDFQKASLSEIMKQILVVLVQFVHLSNILCILAPYLLFQFSTFLAEKFNTWIYEPFFYCHRMLRVLRTHKDIKSNVNT